MNRAALALAAVACTLSVTTLLTRPSSTPGKSVVQAAEAYIQDVANRNGLNVDKEKVIAYRENGTDAVVRVLTTYRPYFQISKNRRLYGSTATVTLVVKLHRGDWNAGSLAAAP